MVLRSEPGQMSRRSKNHQNIYMISLSDPTTVAMDSTVLKNRIRLASPRSCPSCSASMETVAAVGKQAPRTTTDFIRLLTGRKYTSSAVIAGSHTSFMSPDSITVLSRIISMNLYFASDDPMNIIAIGVDTLPIYSR